MGGFMSRDDELRGADVSSTIPYMKNFDAQAKMLVNQVNQLNPKLNFNNKGLVLFNETENYDMYKLFEKSDQVNENNNFSETSPFISSDVYNQLIKNIKNKQSGGAKKHKTKKSKHVSESYTPTKEDRSESSTSSESTTDEERKESNKQLKKLKKQLSQSHSEEVNLEPDMEKDDVFSEMSAGSYISSSAHTDGSESSRSSRRSSRRSEDSESQTTVSVRNNHKSRHAYSDSVNTSDINIISVDE